jgi:signal transduction histidine kinase
MRKIFFAKKASLFYISLLSILVAYLDVITPFEVPTDAFYVLPIWLGILNFGLTGGLVVSSSSILLFYISNYLLSGPGTVNWLALLLNYTIFLLFSYGAHRFILNQRQLEKTRANLQSRLEELNQLYQQSQHLHQENLKLAVTEERNRLAREIHDVLAQGFTAIILQVEAALVNRADPVSLEMRLAQINELAHHNLQEARRSVANLRPLPLDGSSLLEALEQKVTGFAREQRLKANFSTTGQVHTLTGEVEDALFRIAQEALTNIVRHAQASQVQVTLDYDEEEVCLTVEDNGRGFEMKPFSENENGKTFGLKTMQERARLIGGWTTIQSKPGEGCRVRVIVSYHKAPSSLAVAAPLQDSLMQASN